ncbi:carbohydrate ABC transporter permease [Paenibacillus harenae]|uniref:Multiple sugar transport system permease protein n=1 Tax=Paenibacillus harenae TaxID=306543 RepID=A0ABT9U8J9_PAEHA|nr:carbohydrate ABC transporter permease [Paenibacillus harenae]MDQ0063689.1 multiple sugar transport system permease protein [Paenibacillus harenae]MDQ0115969.1 multiple sugar transport system permease protein [Paenibacillus harenae]
MAAQQGAAARPRKKYTWLDAVRIALLSIGSIAMLFPLLWMLTIALKSNNEVFQIPPEWFPKEMQWSNFVTGTKEINFWQTFVNSMFIAVVCTLGQVVSSVLVGYGLARLKFPGRKLWFSLFVGSLMLPGFVGMIPLFHMYTSLGWYDSWLPIIVPAFFGNATFSFLFVQYLKTISVSFDEAAKIDGASDMYVLTKVLVPMALPVIVTMVIFSFQGSWNQYLEPLIYIVTPEKWTLSLAMASYKGTYATAWNLFMAADLIYILPMLLLFFFGQKFFMQGLGSVNSASLK